MRSAPLTPDETRGLLASIVRSSNDAIIGKWLDCTIFSWNAAAERLYGYEAAEVLGRPVSILIPPDRQDELRQIMERVGHGEGVGPYETVRCRKDGRPVHVSLTVSPVRGDADRIIGASAIARDIADSKRAEEALQTAVEKRTAELAAANGQLCHEIERRKRVEAILAGEKRVLELMATDASDTEALEAICSGVEKLAIGVRCSIRVSMDDTASPPGARTYGHVSLLGLPAEFQAGTHAPAGLQILDAKPLMKSWGRRNGIQALLGEPIIGSAGQLLGTLVLAYSDLRSPTEAEREAATGGARLAGIIIEKVRTAERARKQLAELAHVARLATMGEMASGLAHELNQPLCAIVNYTEACLELLHDNSADSQLRQAMVEVAKQSERAGEVIRRLREFVRHREPQRTAVDVNLAVREVVGLTRIEIRQHEVKVTLQMGLRLPHVLADAIQIQQVLVNLVRNAIDAMNETPAIRRRLRIKTARLGPFVEVTVGDSGRGISADAREQVFESFFTTKTHGMGMGLSISRSIVEMHDGRIWVTPNLTSGVTFHFTLPIARRTRHDHAGSDSVRRGR